MLAGGWLGGWVEHDMYIYNVVVKSVAPSEEGRKEEMLLF